MPRGRPKGSKNKPRNFVRSVKFIDALMRRSEKYKSNCEKRCDDLHNKRLGRYHNMK